MAAEEHRPVVVVLGSQHCFALGLPKTIDYVDELPREANGKLYKRRLRDPYWAARDPKI